MMYRFELYDRDGAGNRISLDIITSEHDSLAEAMDEAKSIMSRVATLRGKPEICVIKDADGHGVELGVDPPKP